MNNVRRWVCFFTAAMLATFALPGIAAKGDNPKTYSVTFTADQAVPLTLPVKVTVAVKNTSQGNANMGLTTIQTPPGITIVAFDAPLPNGVATLSPDGTTFSVSYAGNPLKSGQTGTQTVYVTGCGDGKLWAFFAWTGTGGDSFGNDGSSDKTTNIACQTLSQNTAFSVNGIQPQNDPTRVDGFYSSLFGDQTTPANLFLSNNLVDPLTRTVHFRVALDGGTTPPTSPASQWTYVTPPLSAPPTFKVAWPINGLVVFITQPCTSWNFNPVAGLPIDLGVLSAPVGSTGNLPVDSFYSPSTFNTPFYAMVQNPPPSAASGELVRVTKVTGSTWSVDRGVTAQWGATSHLAGAKLRNYPPGIILESLSPYTLNDPAKACTTNIHPIGGNQHSATNLDFDKETGDAWGGF